MKKKRINELTNETMKENERDQLNKQNKKN